MSTWSPIAIASGSPPDDAAEATPADELAPPAEFDDYVIVHELGRGQMGRVYLAEDAVLARPVAIKLIAGVEPDLAARQRFLMEARTAARVQHPNVVAVYRVGELGDRPYIVSELVRGKTVAEVPRPMAGPAVLALAIDLARGLAAAHRRGVVHCDIKPTNAMITDDGIGKLVDFGLARMVHDGHDDAAGPMVGTPDYMAPEVWDGRAPSRRSDVYSFGAVLYELLAGRPPFADVAPRELAAVVRERPAPTLQGRTLDFDPRLARLIARCLDRDPELRFASGEELRDALERLASSRSPAIASDQNPYRGLRPFEADHRGLFFGRGLEIGAVVERLRSDSIVVVTGDSGVGKSSLCRAGVLPAIIDGALGPDRVWHAVTVVPGRRPLATLAAALGDPGVAARVLDDPEALPRELHRRAGDGGLIVFVDQLEELVTVGEPAEVAALATGLARLAEGVPWVRLVATVRADFLSRIAALPRFGGELPRLLYFVSPLPPERIRDVITGPAAATHVEFESEAMIGALVAATAQAGSGGLPLLSFALAELWQAHDRERKLITQSTLDTMGGVAGALARHGDAVLGRMPAADRPHARRVLLRLVTSDGTRVRRSEAELAVSAGTRIALDALVTGRLVVVHDGEDGAGYELAHEVLVHGWGTLRGWLAADADARARREWVAAAAAEWSQAGRHADLTWRGSRLVEARALDPASLTALEREFIAASGRAARRRSWLRGAAVAGAVALVAAGYAAMRYQAELRLAGAVAGEVDGARVLVDQARAADRSQRERVGQAYARFDAGDATAGEALWRQVLAERDTAELAYRAAGGRIEAALAMDPDRDDVRTLLADVLYERARLADERRDGDRRDELITRLAAYDSDGSRRARWTQPGRLIVHAPPGADILLEGRVLGRGRADVVVDPGTYTVALRAAGREPVRAPVAIERGATSQLRLAMPRHGALPDGFVFIPAGRFLFGTADDEETRLGFFQTVPLHARTTGDFLIGRTEVTIADWLAFVADQPAAEQHALLPAMPLKLTGAIKLEPDAGTWRLTLMPIDRIYTARWGEPIEYVGRARGARQDWRRFPITAVTAREAERYAAWLDRTGRVRGARLCTELEWEHAARGADGRSYPGGARLAPTDANYDLSHTRPLMGPDEVASHPAAIGPYGIADASGNAYEWTRSGGDYVVRGGSYYHDARTANLANRSVVPADVRDPTLGIRLCATPAPDILR